MVGASSHPVSAGKTAVERTQEFLEAVGQKEVFSGEVFSESQSMLPITSSLGGIGVSFAIGTSNMDLLIWRD